MKKACAVEELCKLWANELDLCDSVLLICLSKSWVYGSSEKRDFALVMCASHWGLVELEDKSFGLRLVPLLCCWFDRQIPNHILSEWVRQRGLVVVRPFLFGDTPMTAPVGRFVHMALAHAHLSPPEAPAFAFALPPNKKIRAKVTHFFWAHVGSFSHCKFK